MYNKPYPWLVKDAVVFMEGFLDNKSVLEFGMGNSTLWMAERAERVFSIEHNLEWLDLIQQKSIIQGFNNIYFLHSDRPYWKECEKFNGRVKFDFILVDGRDRVGCFKNALPLLADGGVIMLDNSEREEYKECFELAKDMDYRTYGGSDYSGTFTYPGWTTTWWYA